MRLSSVIVGDSVVLSLSGKILGAPQERTHFLGAIQEGYSLNKSRFVVDLNGVERVNSIGLGMLIAGLTSVARQGGRYVLANITNVESILTMTRLIRVFRTEDSVAAALEALDRNAEGTFGMPAPRQISSQEADQRDEGVGTT